MRDDWMDVPRWRYDILVEHMSPGGCACPLGAYVPTVSGAAAARDGLTGARSRGGASSGRADCVYSIQ